MKNLWLVAKFTIKDMIKRKSFIISTIIILGVFVNGISAVIDAYEDIIERIDEHSNDLPRNERRCDHDR